MENAQKIAVITDTCCDLPQEVFKQYPIFCVPLVVACGEESYRDNIDITVEDVYRRQKVEDFKTSLPRHQDIQDVYAAISRQGYTHVVLPQAFRLAIPSLANNFIECFKGSALCSMVGVKDMMLQAKMLANKSYRFMEVYLCVLLLYWFINMVFGAIQKVIEQKANAKY